ncbi:DNA-formamidopyrimidine glycosylase family protein [Microbispora bryophytorum]|uniref:DNA-(apurinic or apyrimidinic site) lyase n=1 Tax=Microbispora bryophytorum TaxID=1460882 RepID=A0A8H9LJQ3_9ACTN|nr:DNA glycosylase [Microbispora bryophytorum]MBD3140877.1 formamidopyrimidine-DNA glycolase [Microbispora bryophytorum]TQS02115.1 formamidopyrimidine-DNA glycolase [Microbispora bryophytorum]GGO29329.1 endonuclease 8 1 [Microbispora bryophytorum]
MPEGHLVHRYADEQHEALAGRVVRATSPQGRFDARPYDGRVVEGVEALGKHLLYRVEDATPIHVHLGMQGLFLRYDDPAAEPRRGTRLRLATGEAAFDLIAPARCEPMDEQALAALRAATGPDPLRNDTDRAEAVRRLLAARTAVGAAVLDQSVWSGVGNAWRAELLFLTGLDPGARDIGAEAAGRLWDAAVRYLALGRDAGQVVSDPDAPDERWVYKRARCRRCAAVVRTWTLASRTAYACPADQHLHAL